MLPMFFSFSSEQEKSKFEHIYDKYKKLLLYKAKEILHDNSLAEDAVSEAFLKIYKNLHKIDDPDSGKTVSFLAVIVKNTAIDILNQSKNIIASDFGFDADSEIYGDEVQSDFNLEEYVISKAVTEEMLHVVDKLKEDLKDCFVLMYAYELSYKEIGKILNISESNVAVRIHRAKKKLIELLREGGYI